MRNQILLFGLLAGVGACTPASSIKFRADSAPEVASESGPLSGSETDPQISDPATPDDGLESDAPPPEVAPTVSADGLPESSASRAFFSALALLNLENPAVEFADGSGGMSINLEYKLAKLRGDFMPRNADGRGDNSAGNPEGQIVAYNLSRIFGYASSYGAAAWHQLKGRPISVLHELARTNTSSNVHVKAARLRVLESTRGATVWGSLSVYGPNKPLNYAGLESEGGPNGLFNTGNPLARFLRASGPQPADRQIALGSSYRVNELRAAKTLSTIFAIDALTEQFDRFSGGNVQVVQDGGLHRLVAFDNGGAGVAGWGTRYVPRYLEWTSRFDPKVADEIVAMNRFVNGDTERYLGFSDRDVFLRTLGLRKFNSSFRKHLATLARHVESSRARYGSDANF